MDEKQVVGSKEDKHSHIKANIKCYLLSANSVHEEVDSVFDNLLELVPGQMLSPVRRVLIGSPEQVVAPHVHAAIQSSKYELITTRSI